jgi:hypothetical protein
VNLVHVLPSYIFFRDVVISLRWAGHVARMGEKRNAYRILVGKPEGKRPLGRPRRRWVDNIKMDRITWFFGLFHRPVFWSSD